MNVYIEYVILDNLSVDLLLLWAAAVTLKLPYKWWRLVSGSAVGALCALLSVFVSGWLVYAVKTLCLVLMCITSCGLGKKLFWYILLTVTYTFILGGAIVAVFNFFNVSYLTENGEFYNLDVPLFVYVLAAFFTLLLCYSVAVYVKETKKIAPYLVKAKVYLQGKEIAVSAFCDSGNTLMHNGIPVCFVTKKFNGFTDFFAEQTLQSNVCKIQAVTVTGTQTVLGARGLVQANGKRLEVYLALPCDKCQTTYNLILANAFCQFDAPEQATATKSN